jgi:glycosyltransferase involved in cell wall biosynthesis
MNVEPVPADDRLRVAVLGDFDGVHTRSWLRWFVERGHDIHAVSYYPPAQPLKDVSLHVLRPRESSSAPAASPRPATSAPSRTEGLKRVAHALRYRRAGLRKVLGEIAPDAFHAHFVVEHGFYGALAGVHPYVVTAWGSDILVAPRRDPISRQIARWTLRRADLVTSNNRVMADEIVRLGADPSRVQVVTLGADAWFAERWSESVNVAGRRQGGPVVLSTRAHEPLYNIDTIIDAFAQANTPDARLVVAHSGSLTEQLKSRAATDGRIEFVGTVDAERLRDLMTDAEVFVSVPSSDGTSVALLQAMSVGAFPIVADLDTQREWITDGENGILVPPRTVAALADAIALALGAPSLRKAAAERNRAIVAERGTNETQMARMEQLYVRLAGRA